MSGRRFWVPFALLVAMMALGFYLVHLTSTVRQNAEQNVTQQLLSTQAADIERTLSHALVSTYIIAQEVLHSDGEFQDFDKYAESVLKQFPGISNLQLAPDGVISRIFPLSGNEAAIGHNILRDDQRRDEAILAIRSQGLTLAGPFNLKQGGIGIIGRNPIFIDQDNQSRFWGFSSALILLQDLVERAGLGAMKEHGYGYELGRINPYTNESEVFSSGGVSLSGRALTTELVVPNGVWFLRMERSDLGGRVYRIGGYVISILLALTVAAFSRKTIEEPERLRKLVAKQTSNLKYLAYHDDLTDLPNRLYFSELLKNKIDQAKKTDSSVALLLIDLDQFKEVNDTLGHDIGDQLLVEFARRIRSSLPDSATIARLGGDEFTIILDDRQDFSNTERVAQTVIDSLAVPFSLKSQQVFVSGSIGIAILNSNIHNSTDLLKCADLAMYDAKNKGRSGYCHYTPSLQSASLRRLRLTHDLKDAIDNHELHLVYQPVICNKTGKIVKAEALIRWSHPQFGTVNPLEFIPLAEGSGLIMSIGEWIFSTAAKQVKHWQTMYSPDFQVSVNASPVQFRSDEHTTRWIECLQELELDGSSILIEITEGILLEDNTDMQTQLEKLKAVGMQFALDDFGTGYSSLAYLKIFPVDYLKIDRSFIHNLGNGSADMFLCELILMIGNKFGMKVVAEGVETIEQYKLLNQLHCHYVQGYYFSKPDSPEVIESLFSESFSDPDQIPVSRAA